MSALALWRGAANGDRAALDALARDALRHGDVEALAELESLAWQGASDTQRQLEPTGWLAIREHDRVLDLATNARLQPAFVRLRHDGADVWGIWDPLTSTWHGHLDRDTVTAVAVGRTRLAMATHYGLVVQRSDGPPRDVERNAFQPLLLSDDRPLLGVADDTFAWVADGAVKTWTRAEEAPGHLSVDTDVLDLRGADAELRRPFLSPLAGGWLVSGPSASRFVSPDGRFGQAGRAVATGESVALVVGDTGATLWWPAADRRLALGGTALELPLEPVLTIGPRGGVVFLRHADGLAWWTMPTRASGASSGVFPCPRPEHWPGTTTMRYGVMDRTLPTPRNHPMDASPLDPVVFARILGERLLAIDERGRLTTLDLGWLDAG